MSLQAVILSLLLSLSLLTPPSFNEAGLADVTTGSDLLLPSGDAAG